MNRQISKAVSLALFSLTVFAAPVRAATDSWNDRRAYAYDHRLDRERDDHARLKQRQWREHHRALGTRNDGANRYSDLASAQNYSNYNPHNHASGPNAALNRGNYPQSGATQVGNQLATGYANLQAAYANALAAGDRSGAQHYLNALKQQQKEIARYNATWGSTAGTISTSALPTNNYQPNYPGSAGNYLQSGATQVGNQLATGYANLQAAYANALAAGDRSGAQHYLNALKQQQKEIAQYNATWGSTAGTISTSALPSNNYPPNYSAYS